MSRERLTIGLLLFATFAVRAVDPAQPIVENYVGRQIPTAMVARNLERVGGFLRPELDTGPFPNLFLVEPPIYAELVALVRPWIGFEWEPTGRLVSAASVTLAAWGLFGLARRREGFRVAVVVVGSFGVLPVMIRYGRAFQPDALMLGCVLAGLRGWDEYEATGDRRWMAFGGFVLSTGLALKVTVAWALIPFCLILRRWPIGGRLAASATLLTPALAWYLHAWQEVQNPGSLASAANASIWAGAVSPGNWLRVVTWSSIARNLVVRSFTPVGFVLAGVGLVLIPRLDRLWVGWSLGCVLAVLGLAAKWHHAYYWMAVAPIAAVGIGRTLAWLADRRPYGPAFSILLGSSFFLMCGYQSVSTWKTPAEWEGLVELARAVEELTSEEEWILAPEAVLYYSDRRGYRLEFDLAASRRAMGEWGRNPDEVVGLSLTDFYLKMHHEARTRPFSEGRGTSSDRRSEGRLLVADVGLDLRDSGRRGWREEIRRRPGTRILLDQPDRFLAELR